MELTPQELWMLRNIVIRAVNEAHDVLATAARRAKHEKRDELRQTIREPHPKPESRAPDAKGRIEVQKLAYTIQEASAALGISRSTFYLLLTERNIPTIRFGRR